MMRSKNFFICPEGIVALYLFERFMLDGEPFPDFTTAQQWYDIMLVKASKSNNLQEISYQTHYNFINEAFKNTGFRSNAVTHAGRHSGALMAELLGAEFNDIRAAGRWRNGTGALEQSYLSALPRTAMRVQAGFTKDGGDYFLARAAIVPPEELLKQVWPMVDEQLANHLQPQSGMVSNGAASIFFFQKDFN